MVFSSVRELTDALKGTATLLTDRVTVSGPPSGDVIDRLAHTAAFGSDVETKGTARWVLLHLIEEIARHAGHADIVRENIDGATAFPLLAAAEGWPSTPWLQPWQPRA